MRRTALYTVGAHKIPMRKPGILEFWKATLEF